jgi:hypothetical protein
MLGECYGSSYRSLRFNGALHRIFFIIKPDILKFSLSLINALFETLWFSLTILSIGLQIPLQAPYLEGKLLDNVYLVGIKILFLQHQSFTYT